MEDAELWVAHFVIPKPSFTKLFLPASHPMANHMLWLDWAYDQSECSLSTSVWRSGGHESPNIQKQIVQHTTARPIKNVWPFPTTSQG